MIAQKPRDFAYPAPGIETDFIPPKRTSTINPHRFIGNVEPTLEELLGDEIMRLLLDYDGISTADIDRAVKSRV